VYTRGTRGVPSGYSRGTRGVLYGVLKASSVEYYAILSVLMRRSRGTQRRGIVGYQRGTNAAPTPYQRGVYDGACVCVCSECVCARARASARRRPRARGCVICHRPGSHASAAGVTWTSRTAKAPWADRAGHTSVIDSAGAIYVIGGGGTDRTTFYADVWVSTDGGARPDSAHGRLGSTGWVLAGVLGVLRGSEGILRKTRAGISEYSRGYSRRARFSTARSFLVSNDS
jgi:hypothetical protein